MGAEDHRTQAQEKGRIGLAIVTVSDTRTEETDTSGQLIRTLAEAAGHVIIDYRIVQDEPEQVQQALDDFTAGAAQIVIFNGGTGISRRDRTYDVSAARWKRRCPALARSFACSAMKRSVRPPCSAGPRPASIATR